MMYPVISGLVLAKKRIMVEIFPPSVRRVWKQWELRAVVFLSLISQIVLITLGNRRKHIPRTWIKVFVWSAYLLADSAATLGLGILLNDMGDVYGNGGYVDRNAEITAFWAPFFLLHLGGPDTITAYSLEDNELYRRHAFNLLFQALATVLIFLTAWNGSLLSILSVPMIIVGTMKYVERTWSLWLASNSKLRDSMLTTADPGPNYRKLMEEYSLKHEEGYALEVLERKNPSQVGGGGHTATTSSSSSSSSFCPDSSIIHGYRLFDTFKCLFADLILGSRESNNSRSLFEDIIPKNHFDIISIELGFMYDLLYTKATVIYTWWGIIRRSFTAILTISVTVTFSIFVCLNRQMYTTIDLWITFSMLGLAIVLEIFGALILVFSDWSRWWFATNHKKMHKRISSFLSPFKFFAPILVLPRWSNSLGQYDLLSYCLKEKPGNKFVRLLCMDKIRQKHRYRRFIQMEERHRLKELIYDHVKKNCPREAGKKAKLRSLYDQRTRVIIESLFESPKVLIRSLTEVDFDQTILTWHIATELCYHVSSDENLENDDDRERSIILSRYMMYLLVMYPFLLPVGIGLIRFRDTCTEFTQFLEDRKHIFGAGDQKINEKSKASEKKKTRRDSTCKGLLEVQTHVSPTRVKGDRSKSVLFDANSIASKLTGIGDAKVKWKMMNDVWIEILIYAASQSRGSQHARQLKRGGELLTHVWLLMAHFGMTEQFKISQGHARAQLRAK